MLLLTVMPLRNSTKETRIHPEIPQGCFSLLTTWQEKKLFDFHKAYHSSLGTLGQ